MFQETVLSAEDTESTTVTNEVSTKSPTPTNNTTESMITTNQSSSSSSASVEQSNRKRIKRTVSSISLSPSKFTSGSDTSTETKTKRQRTETAIKVKFSRSAVLFNSQSILCFWIGYWISTSICWNSISKNRCGTSCLKFNLSCWTDAWFSDRKTQCNLVWIIWFDRIMSRTSIRRINFWSIQIIYLFRKIKFFFFFFQ